MTTDTLFQISSYLPKLHLLKSLNFFKILAKLTLAKLVLTKLALAQITLAKLVLTKLALAQITLAKLANYVLAKLAVAKHPRKYPLLNFSSISNLQLLKWPL